MKKLPHMQNHEDIRKKLEQMKKDNYIKEKSNLNNMSYWLPKVMNCGIKIPETIIIQLSYEQYKWFSSDCYSDKDIKSMGAYIANILKERNFNTNRKLFIKTGNFSNKFDFNSCCFYGLENIGEKFLYIYYASMMVGAGDNTELVIREFIENKISKPTIYNGMPLNTEFRVFYNFDTKEVLGVFNYWDTKVVGDSLEKKAMYSNESRDEYVRFKVFSKHIEAEFDALELDAHSVISKSMSAVDLSGIWSIDLMYVNNEFYLIDMAEGHKSYYYNKIADMIRA